MTFLPSPATPANALSLAGKVLDATMQTRRPYALFVGRNCEWMPADGVLFARLQRNPQRMAGCVGVFDARSCVEDIASAIVTACLP